MPPGCSGVTGRGCPKCSKWDSMPASDLSISISPLLLVQAQVAEKQCPASELGPGLDSALESALLTTLLIH